MITISEKDLEDLFASFRKNKQIVARPDQINIIKKEKNWKVSLTFDSSVSLKRSSYFALKPLWNFLKQKISEQTNFNTSILWEIVREN